MESNHFTYIKIFVYNIHMCNKELQHSGKCLNKVETTLDCGIEMCDAFNGTIPTVFDDHEILGISKLKKYWVVYSILYTVDDP